MGDSTKKTGSFHGKSNKLGHGGRAAQLRSKGVPEAVIGMIARKKHAAPGQKNYRAAKHRIIADAQRSLNEGHNR